MARWTKPTLTLCAVAAFTLTLAPIGVSIYWAMGAGDRLDALAERIGQIGDIMASPAKRTSTVKDCAAAGGADIDVLTERQEGETAAEHSARHIEEHNSQQTACDVTPPK